MIKQLMKLRWAPAAAAEASALRLTITNFSLLWLHRAESEALC
jgi:hypothetical protein